MSIASRIFKTRDLSTTLSINGGGDDLLKGPLGYDFAMAAYLSAMREQKFIETMKADDYKAFVEGKEVEVLVTDQENDDILCVMVQLANGKCVRGDELTDADFRKKETVLAVGCVKRGGKNYNFVIDHEFNLQHVVHKYLLQLWDEVYGLKKSDSDFVDKLLALHYQYNPNEEKPQAQQPAQPQQPTTSASAGVQTGPDGAVTIGNFYTYRPLELKATLVQNKDNTLITDANDAIMGAMSRNLTQAAGIYLGVYGQDNSDTARQRKVAELVGFKEDQINTLFGKKPKDGSGDKDGKDDKDKKDADGKDDSKEEFKYTPYKRCLRFGSVPKMDEGELIPFENIRAALSVVKAIVLDENSSKAKMHKFAKVWDVLQDTIDEASAASRTDVGNIYLHYKLGKINSFELEFSYDDTDYELIFGTDENK